MSQPLPLCSVVVPLYKHQQWLRECLDTVLHQTYPRIELIVIDDRSPDGSYALAQELTRAPAYVRRFERIVCQQNASNQGAHHSLNTGIALARGEYLFLLNSDDRYHPARLTRMVAEMRENGSRFAFSGISPLLTPGSQMPASLLDGIAALEFRAPLLPSLSFAFLQFNCTVTTGNFAVRRDLADAVGPFIDLKLTHDWDFALRAIVHEEPLYVADALYDYRLHPTNTFVVVADRAITETEICLTRYFRSAAQDPMENLRAPSPINWPGAFEHHILQCGLDNLWTRIARGHVRESRTSSASNHRSNFNVGGALKCG